MAAGDQKALDDIAEYGCHVIYVLPEGEFPPFAYSVGIQKSCGAAELIVIGLKQPISHFVVNEYNSRVRAGNRFSAGQRVDGFLEGFECEFRGVDPSHYRDYFGWNLWLYGGTGFEIVQLVFPDTSGYWPWNSEASEYFQKRQPLLEIPKTVGVGPN